MEFDGKRRSNPAHKPELIEVAHNHVDLVPIGSRPTGRGINYHIDLEALDNDALFLVGMPETLDLPATALYRSEGNVYRLGHPLPQGLHYDAYSLLEARPETAPPMVPAPVLPLAARERAVQLPSIDRRIPELERSFTA